jgi:hypothetical protein
MEFPVPDLRKAGEGFSNPTFEESAEEPGMEIFITLEGQSGEFTWEEDEEAREAWDAAMLEDENESTEVTA